MRRVSGYTGHLFEEEVLGRCLARHRGYMRWREAVGAVRENQPRKKTPVVARLEGEVGRLLGGTCAFFSAVGSALDVFHGVDGFFEFEGEVVTIDLTMNPLKDSTKADLLVTSEEIAETSALAGRIARELGARLRRRARR